MSELLIILAIALILGLGALLLNFPHCHRCGKRGRARDMDCYSVRTSFGGEVRYWHRYPCERRKRFE